MDYDNLTVKELLQRFSNLGMETPTFREGLIALLENYDRHIRRQKQEEKLAAIEQEFIGGQSDVKAPLNQATNSLLLGLNSQFQQLPKGIDVVTEVKIQTTHILNEVVDINDQDQDQDQEGHSQSPGDEAREDKDIPIQEEEEEDDDREDTSTEPQPCKEDPKNKSENADTLKRKADTDSIEPAQEKINQGQEVAASAPKSQSKSPKKHWKKQKRVGGRFAAADAPLVDE